MSEEVVPQEVNGAGELPPIGCDVFCPDCGYNLRSLTGVRCPECGYGLERIHLAEPQLPWARRKQLGRFRAYWGTILYVRFRHRRFCEEMARPVSYADAQRFRWVTILHAALGLILASALLYALVPHPADLEEHFDPFPRIVIGSAVPAHASFISRMVHEVWPLALLNVGALLFFAGATGIPSYFFHPKSLPVEMQNRAVALSYYTCGSLAFMVLPALVGVEVFREASVDPEWCIGTLGLVGLLLAGWWADLIRTARRLMRPLAFRAWLVALCVPILWVLLAGLTVVLFPVVVFYVLGIFVSLS